jgi:hypothetical protein
MNAVEVRNEILSWLPHAPKDWTCSHGERGVVIGLMNNALRLNDKYKVANQKRHIVLSFLFRDVLGFPNKGEISSKQMDDRCWWSLAQWMSVYYDSDDNTWKARGDLQEALMMCFKEMENWNREMSALCGDVV